MSNRICNVLIIDKKDLPASYKLEDEMMEMHIVMYRDNGKFICVKNKPRVEDTFINSIGQIERRYKCQAIIKYWKR